MLSSTEGDMWENEVDAYNFLARDSPEDVRLGQALMTIPESATRTSFSSYITKCLGSFERTLPPSARGSGQTGFETPGSSNDPVQDDLDPLVQDIIGKPHIILLEYARGGNLTNFCQRYANLVTSPNREDRVNLWHHLFHLLRALHVVHSIEG
jgi:hypothetical protein